MDERETLIRVEQQLQDSIKNQSLILNDLKEIFSKIEIDSKATTAVKSDLNTHLELSTIRREESDRRFKALEEKLKECLDETNELQDIVSREFIEVKKDFLDKLEDEKKKRIDDSSDSKLFQKQITTSMGMIKWIIGILIVTITAIWPIITFFLDKK